MMAAARNSIWVVLLAQTASSIARAQLPDSEPASAGASPAPDAGELTARIEALLADPPSGPDACAQLRSAYRSAKALIDRGQASELLQSVTESLYLLRKSKACPMGRCNQGSADDCGLWVGCDGLWNKFTRLKAELEAAADREPCALSDLRRALMYRFVDAARVCPRSDARVGTAIGQLVLLVQSGKVEPERAAEVAAQVIKDGDDPTLARAFEQLAQKLKDRETLPSVAREASVHMLEVVSQLLSGQLSNDDLAGATDLMSQLSSVGNLKRVLGILEIVDGLNTPNRREALEAAVARLLQRHPRLRETMPRDRERPVEGLMLDLVRLLNNAELEDFRRELQESGRYAASPVSRLRGRLLVVSRLPACSAEPIDDKACGLAQVFEESFLEAVRGRSLQGASPAEIDGSVVDVIVKTREMLSSKQDLCAEPAATARYGGLCVNENYRGVYVLEVSPQPNAKIRAEARWCVRDVNQTLVCPNDASRRRSDLIATDDDAADRGHRLGRDVLAITRCGVPLSPVEIDAASATQPGPNRWTALLVSGLPQLRDRRESNDAAGWFLLVSDVSLTLTAVTATALAVSFEDRFKATGNPSDRRSANGAATVAIVAAGAFVIEKFAAALTYSP